MQEKMKKHMEVDLLYLVCNRSKTKDVQKILRDQHIFFNLVMYGKGTAPSKTLSYLGLGETEKVVFLCVATRKVCDETAELLDKKLHLEKPGNGIMFITKMQQGCYHHPISFADDENGEQEMKEQAKYNLIMIIANRGYSDEVMDAARVGGASGGTILHARGGGAAGMEKFFGVTVAPEKEVLLIVAKDEVTDEIMSEIAKDNGPESDAACVSFTLPVSQVNGIHDYTNK